MADPQAIWIEIVILGIYNIQWTYNLINLSNCIDPNYFTSTGGPSLMAKYNCSHNTFLSAGHPKWKLQTTLSIYIGHFFCTKLLSPPVDFGLVQVMWTYTMDHYLMGILVDENYFEMY